MKVSVFRKAHFNAAHRLHNPNWSDEKNKAVFGLCNNPNYHGHNYELEVQLTVCANAAFTVTCIKAFAKPDELLTLTA